MSNLESLRMLFSNPPKEFSPVPFWFWNDELSEEELIRQIRDFHAKEVNGFVLHPRMGLSRSIPYLSDRYMDLVEAAVTEAARLGMRVILYDEGMYPSGSACGMVVRNNPEYASRGLQMREYPCRNARSIEIPISLLSNEKIVSIQAVRKVSEFAIDPKQTLVLSMGQSNIQFESPDNGEWSVLVFVDTPSNGTIRGVHQGQDDGEPEAPLAADLLNPHAVQSFISITHERYYERLSRYFGRTVFAMFTDEPDLLGRGHLEGLKPWTNNFLSEWLESGGNDRDLPYLWFDGGKQTMIIRENYETAIRNRMAKTYYKQLADWCDAHGIGLTGHPAGSSDIGLLESFHIPGQDVVWRYIAPGEGTALSGEHSTMGKCSSDAARHRGKRRNLNECFGVCGKGNGWALTADEMKWYLDWLFVRGVNLISPHAFYYSIRDERRDERPPDVGPNNIWWQDYYLFSRYIKRMSWLMTDSVNQTEIAVIAQAARLPWEVVQPLYENQLEFNYLEEDLIHSACQISEGKVSIAHQQYSILLVEDGSLLESQTWQHLREFVLQGGYVIEWSNKLRPTFDIGQLMVKEPAEILTLLERIGRPNCRLEPAAPALRISHVMKDNVHFYTVVNEGEEDYSGEILIPYAGYIEIWDPWRGITRQAKGIVWEAGTRVQLRVERRESLLIVIDPNQRATSNAHFDRYEPMIKVDFSTNWHVAGVPQQTFLAALSSWTQWDGMENFSGTVSYTKTFQLEEATPYSQIVLQLGEVGEIAKVWVNGTEAGVQMWKPYQFFLQDLLRTGENEIRIEVTNTLANSYDQCSLPSGLMGPVYLICE